MKATKLLLLPLLAILLLLAFKPNTADEEATIKAVIERETESYFKGDLAARNACLTQDNSLLVLMADPNARTVRQGFEAENKATEEAFKASPGPWKCQTQKTNWNIKVSGNVAWATFDQRAIYNAAPGYVSNTKEIRCLEKSGGQWRITSFGIMETYEVDTPENREKIQQVCAAETQAWLDADMEKWMGSHTQHESDCLVWNTPDGNFVNVAGWKNIAATVREYAKTAQKDPGKLQNSNYSFEFKGNMAFVSYDQTITPMAGKPHHSREHRYMVLNPWAGGWKIQSVLSFHEQNPK